MGETILNNEKVKLQEAFDSAYEYLLENYMDQKYLWDVAVVKKWGKSQATEKQKVMINRMYKNFDTTELTKSEASQILNRLFYKGG